MGTRKSYIVQVYIIVQNHVTISLINEKRSLPSHWCFHLKLFIHFSSDKSQARTMKFQKIVELRVLWSSSVEMVRTKRLRSDMLAGEERFFFFFFSFYFVIHETFLITAKIGIRSLILQSAGPEELLASFMEPLIRNCMWKKYENDIYSSKKWEIAFQ